MEAIAGKVITGLSSLALEEFNLLHDLEDDKKRMEETVSAIRATLLDAEANATSHQVNDWLEKLKDVLYDADDLLDDFSAESLARKVRNGGISAEKVCTFCSKLNQVAYGHKMSRRMKDIRKKFDGIADDKSKLQLVASPSKPPNAIKERRPTSSFVREEDVIGREEEKNLLKSFLLNPNVSKDVSIIAIVGFGGLGKTALAQLVYNDAAVQSYFEPKMWVRVSDQFDMREIGQKMVESERDANTQKVQEKIRKKIKGRRYLLVLDDVWNENRNLWLELKSLLMEGGKGSMIIVTTRIANVKKIMDVDFPLDLKGLDDERSWKLFSQMAFREGKEPDIPKLAEIGKEIVKKCAGIPLALKAIGILLYTRDLTESDWLYVRDNELLRIDQENNEMLPILQLSYDHLSSNLKNCFVFCSLFPKDYRIERETLIQLWMAQGFIPDQDRHLEDLGNEYFMNLLSRSFFRDVESDEFGDIKTCKLHDFMHDLATSMSKDECMVIKEGKKENIGDRTRHLSFYVVLEACWKPPTCLLEAGKLRTLLLPYLRVESDSESTIEAVANLFCCRGRWNDAKVNRAIISSLIFHLKGMRILDLHQLNIPEIPKCIQNLKHLRYLDLSYNDSIEKLPKGITRLHNLQTLKLNGCRELKELPTDINKLVSLRHLELNGCRRLSGMPHGLGQLTRLQTLTHFRLGPRKSDSARLSELGSLNNLRGHLSINGLEHMRGNVEEVGSTKLLVNSHVRVLELVWSNRYDYNMGRKEEEEFVGKDEMILQDLQPSDTIKVLSIRGFCGNKLSDWIEDLSSLEKLEIGWCRALTSIAGRIGNLSSLQDLKISGCEALTSLPESICKLSSLRNLKISFCQLLTSIPERIGNLSLLQHLEIWGCEALTSLPESICNLSSLRYLKISFCQLLTSIPERISSLSLLQHLEICGCEALTSLPESICNLSSLRYLTIGSRKLLTSIPERIGNLSLLQHLEIWECEALTSLPESICNLSSLRNLKISFCQLLTSIPERIGCLSLLQHLEIWGCEALTSLPESICNLTSLRYLTIRSCKLLASIPERIGDLSSLQDLKINGCEALTSLPGSICNLSSLRYLTIGSCKLLTSIPERIGNLSLLRRLEIWGCEALISLPESICNLSSLRNLKISFCQLLTSIPERIGNLSVLRRLEIWGCEALTSLPESICNLSSLQYLTIGSCKLLTSIPESIGQLPLLEELRIFDCHGLRSIPQGIRNLKSLQLLRIHGC